MQSTTILDVLDGRTRDFLRGLLSQKEQAQVRPTFERLMQNVSYHDLPTVDRLLRTNPLYKHLEFREEFPLSESPFAESSCFDVTPRKSARIEYVRYRANLSDARIARALDSLAAINRALFDEDDESLLVGLADHLLEYGHSLTLARKLAFILGHFNKGTESWKTASTAFSNYGLESRNYGMMAVADTISIDFPYLGLKTSFAEFGSLGPRATASRRVAYLSFNPIIFGQEEVLDGLSASYFFSLIDGVIYLLAHRDLGILPPEIRLAPAIEQSWDRIQADVQPTPTCFNDEDQFADAWAFRAAPAFLEVRPFREYRAALQRLYNVPELRAFDQTIVNPYENRFYANVKTVRDLLPGEYSLYDPLPTQFDREVAGSLARSCGLVRIALQNPDFSGIDSEEIGCLMGRTADVDWLLPPATLRAAAASAKDPFVVLILLILLRAHSPQTLDLFRFKKAFQDYVNSECGGSIISFIDLVYRTDRGIVEYLVPLLDETTLSQIPFLVNTAEGVYETRASILEWFAQRFDEPTYKDKAKQLRIDRKIASVRGQINETRINIDGLRFRQWIETSKQSEFSALIRQESAAAPFIGDVHSKRSYADIRLTAHRDPNARAAVAIMDCYREFCVNPDFGIASYLGRRIRHGTLKGTLLDNLPNPDEHKLSAAVRAQFEKWLDGFKLLINRLTEMLHFRGRGTSSEAIISPEVDSKEKWDVAMICLQSVFDNSQKDHGATIIPIIVEQYCWYIFEVELRHIQQAVLETRSDSTLFKVRAGIGDSSALNFEKAVNLVVTTHFNTVASWFRKPANISPVAEVGNILEVVRREAQAEYAAFQPEVSVSGGGIKLSGGVYYNVYDALSVVVRNAAKHGLLPGRLVVDARSAVNETGERLTINVLTDVKADDSASQGVARIYAAASGGAADADVVEGLSGMRKLEKMKVDGALLDFCVVPLDCDRVIETEVVFATKGSV